MKAMRKRIFALGFWALLACRVPLCADEPVLVRVDTKTQVFLGDSGNVSGALFGVTAFEGFPSVVADADYRGRLAALRPGVIRLPGSVAWHSPERYDPSWFDSEKASRQFEESLLFGARYPLGRFLPLVRGMGAEAMCSLGSPPAYLTQEGTRHPSDFDQWAAYCAGYVGLWKRFDPDLRLVQIWNEPNATWYEDPRIRKNETTATDLHIQMALKVAGAVKERFPEVQLGGPVLCWPPSWPPNQKGHRPWYTWKSWTLPWLESTRDLIDFFDFHVYDISPDVFAVQVEMLTNQSQLTQDRRIPIWITESNYHLEEQERSDPRAIWEKRILPYERFLLRGVMAQSDKVAGNLYHDLHAHRHTLLPGDPERPDPSYWLLWLFRDLRGKRIHVSCEEESLWVASTLEKDRVTVLFFNDEERVRTVKLEVSLPGYWTGPKIQAIGPGNDGACGKIEVHAEMERKHPGAVGKVTLPSRASCAIHFRLGLFPEPARCVRVSEVFGDCCLQFIGEDHATKVAISSAKTKGNSVSLRIGLLGPSGEETFVSSFNGEEIQVRPVPLQEIQIQADRVGAENKLKLRLERDCDNPKLALAFASLVWEEGPTPLSPGRSSN